MPTIETVKTCHNKAATTTCSVATIKNTQQSTSSGLMKKEMKCQRRVSTETATGIKPQSKISSLVFVADDTTQNHSKTI
eukprot:7597985-Ditylum_brightwellii.AAC.1